MSDGGIPLVDSATQSRTNLVTAGSILRAAREREGLHVAALAVSMKVPVKKLEALEADRLDLLPDAVFVRALAASVCRALKIESTSVLELLPSSTPPKLRPEGRGINTPFTGPRYSNASSLREAFAKPTGIVVSLLLIAALGVYFFPESTEELTLLEGKNGSVAESSHGLSVPSLAVATSLRSESVAADNANGYSTSNETEPIKSAALAQNNVVQVPALAAPLTSGVGKSQSSSPSVLADALITFKARGAAWVQVTDGKGVQLISRTLTPGEVAGISGVLPFAVVVGRSDLTTVEVRGKSFDLSGLSQNNVARFEIKP